MKENTVKNHAGHGFTQFKLTNYLLNNLSQFKITPTAKLVLLELSACYNPNKPDMFPKQKTLAKKIGVSERSVVRAIQELVKAGLILIESKYTNHYVFTSKIGGEWAQNKNFFTSENMSDDLRQNITSKRDNLSRHEHEPIKEQKKEPTNVEDFKILKQYAQEHKANNVTAYVNWLKRNGKDTKIIADFKAKEQSDRFFAKQIEQTKELIQQNKRDAQTAVPPTKEWKELKAKLLTMQ